jgi:hypothetical protein
MQRAASGSGWRPGIAVVVLPVLRPQRNLMRNFGIKEMRGDEEALADTMPSSAGSCRPAMAGDVDDSAFLPIGT